MILSRRTIEMFHQCSSVCNRFCKRIQFRLLRRTIRDKYELLSEIDNKIRIYDWNVKTFKLGSRFYHNFYAYARKYAMKAFNRCERRLRQKFYYLKMEMIKNKMEDCEVDLINQAESHRRLFGIWVVFIYHLKLKNYLEDLAWIFQFAPKKFPALD